jgi:hypothetical protein
MSKEIAIFRARAALESRPIGESPIRTAVALAVSLLKYMRIKAFDSFTMIVLFPEFNPLGCHAPETVEVQKWSEKNLKSKSAGANS